jgi:hypothetical protein
LKIISFLVSVLLGVGCVVGTDTDGDQQGDNVEPVVSADFGISNAPLAAATLAPQPPRIQSGGAGAVVIMQRFLPSAGIGKLPQVATLAWNTGGAPVTVKNVYVKHTTTGGSVIIPTVGGTTCVFGAPCPTAVDIGQNSGNTITLQANEKAVFGGAFQTPPLLDAAVGSPVIVQYGTVNASQATTVVFMNCPIGQNGSCTNWSQDMSGTLVSGPPAGWNPSQLKFVQSAGGAYVLGSVTTTGLLDATKGWAAPAYTTGNYPPGTMEVVTFY